MFVPIRINTNDSPIDVFVRGKVISLEVDDGGEFELHIDMDPEAAEALGKALFHAASEARK